MSKVNKKELITLLAEELDVKKTEATRIHDVFVNVLEDLIVEQQAEFKLGDIGTFKVPVRPEREHINPQTGGKVVKPAHFALTFKPSANIKRELESYEIE
ncbi:HU family DNA-binding protein [Siminovitchia sp. 179-K 8D1 HS]|uniref:HU family DNA-binding protein n=1 Tax=Siminovitchia sp. 179-K 8D1 HS TaxID=3142385 RepID=UPI0039A304BB